MNDGVDDPRDEAEMLAGEYVLGVLDADGRRAVQRQAMVDPRLERAIAAWERQLHPLTAAAPRAAPPDGLWARIQLGMAARPAAARLTVLPGGAAPRPVPAPRTWPWKAATAVSLALAAGIAAFAFLAAPANRAAGPAGDLLAVLAPVPVAGASALPQMAASDGEAHIADPPADQPDHALARREPGFLVAARPDGTLVLSAYARVVVPGGKALELWIEPPGATAPTSLGLLPATGREIALPAAPPAGTMLLVSQEPSGGSPTGAPTGPVVFAGTLQGMRL